MNWRHGTMGNRSFLRGNHLRYILDLQSGSRIGGTQTCYYRTNDAAAHLVGKGDSQCNGSHVAQYYFPVEVFNKIYNIVAYMGIQMNLPVKELMK